VERKFVWVERWLAVLFLFYLILLFLQNCFSLYLHLIYVVQTTVNVSMLHIN